MHGGGAVGRNSRLAEGCVFESQPWQTEVVKIGSDMQLHG